MKAYRPTVVPHTMVAFAPTDAPRRTRVFSYRDRRTTWLRGLDTLVNTHDGPRNTSSSITAPSYRDTLFWILTLSPMTTPVATWTFCPRMHRLPSLHFGMTWLK